MDPYKRVGSQTQDWSDEEKARQEMERARALRQKLEEPDPEEDAWILERLKRKSNEDT